MNVRELALATSPNSMVVRRWAGAWADFVVALLLLEAVSVLIEAIVSTGVLVLVSTFVVAAYYVGMEVALGGTVGKFAMSLRVVDQNGARPSLRAAAIRTGLRLLEVNPFLLGGLPAGLIVNYSPTKQRLGDLLARTFVLKRQDLEARRTEA